MPIYYWLVSSSEAPTSCLFCVKMLYAYSPLLYPDLHPEFSGVGPVIGSHISPGTVGISWYLLTPQFKKTVDY
jgi:hypothetical protein